MRINRAIGLVLFLLAAKFIFADMFGAFASAGERVLETLEAAAIVSQERMRP